MSGGRGGVWGESCCIRLARDAFTFCRPLQSNPRPPVALRASSVRSVLFFFFFLVLVEVKLDKAAESQSQQSSYGFFHSFLYLIFL